MNVRQFSERYQSNHLQTSDGCVAISSRLPLAELPRKKKLEAENEAWQVGEDGNITEGTSRTWILTREKELITRAPTNDILNSITRLTIIEIAAQQGIKLSRGHFRLPAKAAEEAFTSSATSFVTPVVQIDDTVLSNEPGTLTINLIPPVH